MYHKNDLLKQTIGSNELNTNESPILFSSPIELSTTNYSTIAWRLSFIDLLRPIFFSTQFARLDLFWSGMSYGTSVKLLSLLLKVCIEKTERKNVEAKNVERKKSRKKMSKAKEIERKKIEG